MYNQFPDYINCLNISSENTGNLQVFYDLESGKDDYIYNLVHPKDDHFVGNAIHTDKLPGLSLGKTDLPVTKSGLFEEEEILRVGRTVPFDNWSATIDINPYLCSYRSKDNLSRVLISTMESSDTTSGFHVGINQSNRLYIQYNDNQNTYVKTLPSEINNNSVVGISKGETDIFVHYFDPNVDSGYFASVPTENVKHSNHLFIGNFNSNSNKEYTGYLGYIHNFALFSGEFAGDSISKHSRCMFGKGTYTETISHEDVSYEITGNTQKTVYTTGVTGFKDITSYLPQEDGVNVPIYYKSGITGLIEAGEETVLLTGKKITHEYDTKVTGVIYDEEKEKLYSRYFMNFRDGLVDGEKIEIHSFKDPRFDLQLKPKEDQEIISNKIRLYYYGAFNQASGDQTASSPHVFDYFINPTGGKFFLSGYDLSQHNLIYDLVDTGSICLDFSGHWGTLCSNGQYDDKTSCEANNGAWGDSAAEIANYNPDKHHRIDVDISLGGFTWFPWNPQFIETGHDTVTITGVLGKDVHERDVYMNGQKLIYGEGYQTGIHTEPDFCSDDTYTTQATCEAAGTCSDDTYTTKTACEGANPAGTWTFETWNIGFSGPAVTLLPNLPGWGHESQEVQTIDGSS